MFSIIPTYVGQLALDIKKECVYLWSFRQFQKYIVFPVMYCENIRTKTFFTHSGFK